LGDPSDARTTATSASGPSCCRIRVAASISRSSSERPADAVAAGERVVDHEHHRLRAARHRRAARPARGERLGDRQRQRDAGEEPHHQQQPLAQLQPPRGLALRADQERQRGELHDPGAAPADQVDHQRDRHADQPDQHQRREERHRRSRGPRRAATSASSVSSSGRVVSARW
jgi:hypothetical protein